MISREGDADMADTIVRLNEVQYAYQAALQSGAKIMNSSLMDYLR
jgi:flagellin-like hook-associated protein FlgL